MKPIYLDYNATTPLDPRVSEYLAEIFSTSYKTPLDPKGLWGNPSSPYTSGSVAKEQLVNSKKVMQNLISAPNGSEFIFLSGGSESINFALKAVAYSFKETVRKTIITSTIEHVAVMESLSYLEKHCNFKVVKIPVDENCLIKLDVFQETLEKHKETTCLVSIMLANNEVGTIQPLKKVSDVIREVDPSGEIVLHSDASQAIGKLRVEVQELGVDLLSLAGHKFYAPKGVGGLYIGNKSGLQESLRQHRLIQGANQENGFRAGTENVILAGALAKAAHIVIVESSAEIERMKNLRNLLLEVLQVELNGSDVEVRVNGGGLANKFRLPNTLSVSFKAKNDKSLSSSVLLKKLEGDVLCSAGSACHSGNESPSGVLMAMNVPIDFAKCTLRLSLGRLTKKEEVLEAAKSIAMQVLDLASE
eukprot:maker-scaffold_4-snap-gene-5.67-mRNA-1 protein AED:0.30 eAED:0.30 QI:0/0/0/1/0.5/0.33/3/0/417